MNKPIEFCNALDHLHVRHGLLVARDDEVIVTVVVPGEYVESEFFADGSAEIERFLNQVVEAASDADLQRVMEPFRA